MTARIAKFFLALCGVLLAAVPGRVASTADDVSASSSRLIPREALFGNPLKSRPQISPDGSQLAYLAPSKAGIQNIWVQTIDTQKETMVTDDRHRGIRTYFWVPDGKRLIYLQDSDGDENFHTYLVDLKTKLVRDLTPFQGVRAVNPIVGRGYLLAGLNLRDRQVFDMYRIDLDSGALTLDTENPGDVLYMVGTEWMADADGCLRAVKALDFKTGDSILRIREGAGAPWRELARWRFGSLFDGQVAGFSKDGKALYVVSSTGVDRARLVKMDLKSGKELAVVAEDDQCDIWLDGILCHPETREIQAFEVDYLKPEWHVLDASLNKDFNLLRSVQSGHFSIENRDRQDDKWVVAFRTAHAPTSYYLYERGKGVATRLFTDRPQLDEFQMAPVEPLIIKASDGLPLVSYLTLPVGVEPRNLPMILYVHGGPTARDNWTFDPFVQMLANRGYAVLQVNFRGSVGFGQAFQKAGNREMGVGRMQQDLTDAVQWAVAQGYADRKRIGIFGISYGGYAVLAGLTFTPELFACGAEECGPSNIMTLLQSIPPYYGPLKTLFSEIFGDAEKDEEYNRKISPLFHVDKLRAPLLIGQGVNDPRCKMQESEQIVNAIRKQSLPVDYVVYSDEGHGFFRPENKLDFNGRVEQFFSRHLGGRSEPFEKVKGSSAEVK